MIKKTVTVQLKLDDSSLYFQELGEMLSRHVSELCSRGNFETEFAAGIYRALADQLENAEFEGASTEKLEHLAREGFDKTIFGNDGKDPALHIQTPDLETEYQVGLDVPNLNDAWPLRWTFRDTKEFKRVSTIMDKCIVDPNRLSRENISSFLTQIGSNLNDFKKAQARLENLAESKNLRVERRRSEWRKRSSVDEIVDFEENIVFLEEVLCDYRWSNFLAKVMKYCIVVATQDEIEDFAEIYKKLPSGFQTIDGIDVDNSFPSRISEIRTKLHNSLEVGMYIDDIKAFSDKCGLSGIRIPIKQRVEHLVEVGIAQKGKKNGKVFFSLTSVE